MTQTTSDAPVKPSRDWIKVLAQYSKPKLSRSILEIAATFSGFAVFWLAAYFSLSTSYWLTLLFCIPGAVFLVRIFLIQHDCGHGSFFANPKINDWVGRVMGVFTMTPYQVWRRAHAIHHATSGNLDRRGSGDIETLTTDEYNALSTKGKMWYRFYRHPFTLFVIGPAFVFLLRHRYPLNGLLKEKKYWLSAMGTNLGILALAAVMIYFLGLESFLLIQLPMTVMAASIGVWMFYVQHQFEDTYWAENDEWNHADAALYGSSYYALPPLFAWLTGNIGIHHVHHLYGRIPFYRLPQVLRDNPDLANIHRITFWESLSCVKLQLWDNNQRKLVSFANAAKA